MMERSIAGVISSDVRRDGSLEREECFILTGKEKKTIPLAQLIEFRTECSVNQGPDENSARREMIHLCYRKHSVCAKSSVETTENDWPCRILLPGVFLSLQPNFLSRQYSPQATGKFICTNRVVFPAYRAFRPRIREGNTR